jgi:hypothetical protein
VGGHGHDGRAATSPRVAEHAPVSSNLRGRVRARVSET